MKVGTERSCTNTIFTRKYENKKNSRDRIPYLPTEYHIYRKLRKQEKIRENKTVTGSESGGQISRVLVFYREESHRYSRIRISQVYIRYTAQQFIRPQWRPTDVFWSCSLSTYRLPVQRCHVRKIEVGQNASLQTCSGLVWIVLVTSTHVFRKKNLCMKY